MRVAPLVITTNWMTKMMMKMMMPTASEPAVTRLLKVLTTSPAPCMASSGVGKRSPAVKINLVVATFKTRRKSVSASNNEGKDGEFERAFHIDRGHQNDDRERDIDDQKKIENECRKRDEDDDQQGNKPQREDHPPIGPQFLQDRVQPGGHYLAH